MLHIILGILKVIGILLLLILFIVLAVILSVLFVPVHYRAKADFHDDIIAEGRITWFLRFLSVEVLFRKKRLEYAVKLLGIALVQSKAPEKEIEKKKHTTTKKMDTRSKDKPKPRPKIERPIATEEDDDIELEVVMEEKVTTPSMKKSLNTKTILNKTETITESCEEISQKESLFVRIGHLIQKKKDIIEKIKEKIRNIKQTIDDVKKKIEKIRKFIDAKETKCTLSHLKKEICYLLWHIRPRKLEGNLTLGLDDPGSTGQVLGYLSIVQGLTGNHLQVEGVFDRKVTEGDVFLQGHIRLYHFIKMALSMILDKNVRITIKRLRKLRQ